MTGYLALAVVALGLLIVAIVGAVIPIRIEREHRRKADACLRPLRRRGRELEVARR